MKPGVLGVIGYLLSPLSWWNDAYINLPIAYVLSLPLLPLGHKAFTASIVTIYWLTNLVGLIVLHHSARSFAGIKSPPRSLKRQLLLDISVTCGYTLLVVALAYFDMLPMPAAP